MEITKVSHLQLNNKKIILMFALLLTAGIVYSLWTAFDLGVIFPSNTAKLLLDQEHLLNEVPLNSGTQSINRYNSRLRDLNHVTADFDTESERLTLVLHDDAIEGDNKVKNAVIMSEIEARFLAPLLPYSHNQSGLDDFSRFNLMLAEYARSGIALSHQQSNRFFGSFYDKDNFFDANSVEYLYTKGEIKPNPVLLPKRISVINNCLTPGLWEISASDSVGEMYHSWFKLPKNVYLSMVRHVNNIQISDWALNSALKYKADLEVPLSLDRLRVSLDILHRTDAVLAGQKPVGGYSSQDSRRKVQRDFFNVKRDNELIDVAYFSDLEQGDIFELHKFVSPGVYTPEESENIPFDPNWRQVEIREVKPLTFYEGNRSQYDQFGHIELTLYSTDRKRAIIAGNIPVALLVFQEDYDIPALGVGVFRSSEPIERRYLRMKQGPFPHYAYMAKLEEGIFYGVNNHKYGLEQIFLRPFEKEGQVFLRLTLVSYERIMDILEMEIPLNQDLATRISAASEAYKSPLYRTYLDSNIL